MDEFQQLTERQERILAMVVRSYIETGKPVGSRTLVEDYGLDFSSATVRNDFAALGELGYVAQLHTSAGRIPTERGYRYFVQKLLGEFHLPLHERQMIRHQFHQARLELDQWMRLSAAILARTSGSASFVTAPQARANRFKHIQLIATQGRLVLMVLVLYGGEVKQQMLTLAEPLPQNRLSAAADKLNGYFADMDADEIGGRIAAAHLDTLESEIVGLVVDILRRNDHRSISDIYRDGLVNILNDEGTRQAIPLLEERTLLASVLSVQEAQGGEGVQVVIGGDGRWEELKDCTMILSRYGVTESFSGTLAVVGPTRMPYDRNVAAVRYVADLMSGFVYDYFVQESADAGGSTLDQIDRGRQE
ncbi:MAG: heat-inducible transcription repressor HrcA [Anaerolineae bacterium]|uniref:heat-inducible transcriptional repressor HrcA n=1 Tax=Promineifilum sp. TaxID=2664178 RepID=UPI001D54ACD1|nr:heat-inducible transcription repressor HrcA [Anaerolineales bacterium]MCB8934128.1 heat-inducible transcription repressor HrcA [Promineifilum sp.]MCO5179750.1 heat-inducible transcriptional repressor HrcA [Promineifilum sp.]MCW5845690.1 heat-inducible transcription repressor HrcA [Anaerolineae bacterium]